MNILTSSQIQEIYDFSKLNTEMYFDLVQYAQAETTINLKIDEIDPVAIRKLNQNIQLNLLKAAEFYRISIIKKCQLITESYRAELQLLTFLDKWLPHIADDIRNRSLLISHYGIWKKYDATDTSLTNTN